MRAVIFGGTTEAKELSLRIAGPDLQVTVLVATDYGAEEQGHADHVTVKTGRKDAAEMAEIIRGAAVCIDATHPYATEATKNIRLACATAHVPYRRLKREESTVRDAFVAENAKEAAAFLENTPGNILLTTGAKEIPAFAYLGPERLYVRILPSQEGIAMCEAAGIPHRNIIAMQGPFSLEMNEAVIRQYGIGCVVTKDGGDAGGFREKAQAAKNTGAILVVIKRPEETGYDMEEIVRECLELKENMSR